MQDDRLKGLIEGESEEYVQDGTKVIGWQARRGPQRRLYAECTSVEAASAALRLLAVGVEPKPPCHTARWSGDRCDAKGPGGFMGHTCRRTS